MRPLTDAGGSHETNCRYCWFYETFARLAARYVRRETPHEGSSKIFHPNNLKKSMFAALGDLFAISFVAVAATLFLLGSH